MVTTLQASIRSTVAALIAVMASITLASPGAAATVAPTLDRVEKDAGKGWRVVTYRDQDGKESGIRTTYDERGRIRLIEQIAADRKEGVSLEFDEKGTLRMQGAYVRDLPHGAFITFDEHGKVSRVEQHQAPAEPAAGASKDPEGDTK